MTITNVTSVASDQCQLTNQYRINQMITLMIDKSQTEICFSCFHEAICDEPHQVNKDYVL